MKIAVTGGSGDLGRHLIPYLVSEGHTAVGIDRSLPPPTMTPQADNARLVANVTDYGDVVAALTGCDAVIHLAAHRSPLNAPAHTVYSENVSGSYNILSAAAALGIKRVCLASSINAIGGVFSRNPQYDYFPVDEEHPSYAEDPYSMSKWALEKQADAFARLHADMSIASLRFHWLTDNLDRVLELTPLMGDTSARHLWAYTLSSEASRACLLSLTADFKGHEAFYIVAPQTAISTPSADLAAQYYPSVPIRTPLPANSSFFDCSKAQRLLGWQHQER